MKRANYFVEKSAINNGAIYTKPYEYGLSITSQFYFCGVPFRLDSTPKCDLNCLYCFAMSRGGRRTSNKLVIDINRFEKKLYSVFEGKNIDNDVNSEMLAKKVPIHFGGISDPFSNNQISNISFKLLNILFNFDYPVIISTKNVKELLNDRIIDLLKKIRHIAVQISIITLNKRISNLIEPNVPSPEIRIKAIKELSNEGIFCICRIQPLIYGEIEGIIDDLIPQLGEADCKHVIVEYLKLPVEINSSLIKDMLQRMNWDAYDFYKRKGAILVGREWLLPADFKWEHLQPIIERIHYHKMTYGAGDYGLNHLGDTDCCCGIDNLVGFENWFMGNFSNIIKSSKSNILRISELEKYWYPKKSIKKIINSKCRLDGRDHSIIRYLKSKWNSPGTANAPDSFFGVRWSGDYDDGGNCIYINNNKRR